MTRNSAAQWSQWERILMTGRTTSTHGDTIVHTPHTASAAHGTGAGTTTLGTGMPGHIILGTTDTEDGMADGTIRGITAMADGTTHGTTDTADGTDTCIHTTADGTAGGIHTGTTITTMARSISSATRMTAGTGQDTAPAQTEYSPAGFRPAVESAAAAQSEGQRPQARHHVSRYQESPLRHE